MKNAFRKIILSIVLISVVGLKLIAQHTEDGKQGSHAITYTNPIINSYLADPNILFENGYYYFFATGKANDGNYIPIYKSENLSKWEFVRGAVKGGDRTDWNHKHFWAPEVVKINGKFYLYYTASPEHSPANAGNRVGLAVSETIEGPYRNVGVVVPNASIDGHPVLDNDGRRYIFYTIEHGNERGYKAGQIFVDELIAPEKVAGNPIPIITHHAWQEGPFIIRGKNQFLLTYSCGNWTDSTYHIRYAIADQLTGPYSELPDTIMKSNAMVKGPGHHSFFKDRSGKTWIVYHGWDTAHTARYPRLDRVYLDGDKIKRIEPTYTKQIIE
jgi:beta-xylosidase